LRPVFDLNTDGAYTRFEIEQLPPASPAGLAPVLRAHRLRLGLYDLAGGRLALRKKIEIDVDGARTDVSELVNELQPDLLLINDDDLTYAKVRLDERSLSAAVKHAHTIESSLTRALIWGAVWDMVRDGETPTGTYVELVCNSIAQESDIGVVQSVLRQVRTAVDVYAAPENRREYLLKLGHAALSMAQGASAWSDHQLAFARAFASCAVDESQLQVLKNWLAGVDVLPGLVIDTDFRWALVMRLVVMGQFGETEIAAEVKRDDTATGRENAAGARAALPELAAKLKAWGEATESEDSPNAVVGAIVGSIAQADQPQFLAELARSYFEQIPKLWSHRTHEIGQTLLMGLYPALVVEPATIENAHAAIARFTDLPVGARRIIEEQTDLTARALNCRQADAQVSR
jgi:aminopeptidase N